MPLSISRPPLNASREKRMDEADRAGDLSAPLLEADVAAIRKQAAEIPKGKPGDCDECGEPSLRLVDGLCAACRDRIQRYRERTGRR